MTATKAMGVESLWLSLAGSWAQRCLVAAFALLVSSSATAEEVRGASPRTSAIEFKLGGYRPEVGRGLSSNPYTDVFGDHDMLLVKVEYNRQLFQAFGSLAIGASAGYAEKFGRALVRDPTTGNLEQSPESTGLRVAPFELLAVYRFDWLALRTGIPFVPYGKAGLACTAWWAYEGSSIEVVQGQQALGARTGYSFTGGLALLLDGLQPRFARDFDSDLGVNHSYLFAEYVTSHVNSFGKAGLSLSDDYWMVGLALEY